jgi:hypothetical protein
MKSILVQMITLIAMLGIWATASADTSFREVWTCNVNEGKTIDDVRAANSRWVKFINANVDGGGITSHIITSVVGNASTGSFGYVDSFPSLESWTAAKSATDGNEEGEAIDEALGEAAECSENRLYEAEES